MNKTLLESIRPLVFIFVFITAFAITGRAFLARYNINNEVVIGGNTLLFAVSLLAFFITVRSLRSNNPQAFVRAMYGSFMIKFFIVVIAAFVYIMMMKKDVNKPALGVCAGLYIIYTIFETKGLTRLLRKKKDA